MSGGGILDHKRERRNIANQDRNRCSLVNSTGFDWLLAIFLELEPNNKNLSILVKPRNKKKKKEVEKNNAAKSNAVHDILEDAAVRGRQGPEVAGSDPQA